MKVEELLRERLLSLAPTELDIIDESHLHVGHSGSGNGAQHFMIRIVSPKFQGLTRVAQHRLIYAAVVDLIPFPIHALRIESMASTVV